MLRVLASTSIVFYSGRIRALVVMATYILHRLIMGKVKIDIFSAWDIWNKILQKCLLSGPLCFICIFSKSLNLISCQGDKKELKSSSQKP